MKKHTWFCLGGGGGWEVWECKNCHRTTIPSGFGFLWPSLLQFFIPRFRCVKQEDVVFVAIALPNGDGSGRSRILGVYLDEEKAQSRCYRATVKSGGQPLAIIKCTIDEDREDE